MRREIMKGRLIALLGALLCSGSFVVRAQVPVVLGVWEFNNKASTLPTSLFPMGIKSEIRSYYQRDDGYLVVLALRVNGNGSPDFIQVTARSDGKDYPQYQSSPLAEFQVHGTATPFTYSETITDDHTAQIIAKRAGAVINKGSRRISADGRTMTLNVVAVQADGKEIPIVLVFDRIK
jgi:hypothetical protein